MNDITINANGTYLIDRYQDLVPADFETAISQKIYDAIMSMPPSLASGMEKSKISILQAKIRTYINEFFAKDIDIDPYKIEISTVASPSDNAAFRFVYNDTMDNGIQVNFKSNLEFSLSSGAILKVDYSPAWLEKYDSSSTKEITLYREIKEYVSKIELSVHPEIDSSGMAVSDIIIMNELDHGSVTSRTLDIVIPVKDGSIIYPVSRYIDSSSINSKREIVRSINVTSADAGITYSESEESGELVLVCRGEGNVYVTATLMNILQYTRVVEKAPNYSRNAVYPLKPARGKILAVFPKTIKPGKYAIKYKGYK